MYGWTKGFPQTGGMRRDGGLFIMSRGSEGASAESRDISTNLYSTHRWGFMPTHQDDYSAIHLLLFSISPPSPQQLKNGSIRGGGQICKKA